MSMNAQIAAGMAGVGMNSYGAYQQAQAENYSREWNSFMAGQQAELATAKASIFRSLGAQERAETLQEYDALRSQQRAQYSSSGVNVNKGSALDTQATTAKMGVYEAQKAEFQRESQAWEMDMEARAHRLEQQFGMASQVNPWVPAMSAAIGGTTSIYSTYGKWMKS